MTRLIRLYPRAWRARYGDELLDLAGARPLGLRGTVDVARGALDAHRHPELVDVTVAPPTGVEPVSRRRLQDLRIAQRLGVGSGLGSILWIVAWVVAANGPMVGTGDDAYRDGSAAMPLYFSALALLSAGLVGQMIRLPGRAKVARLGALIALLAAPVWGLGPWLFPFAFILFAGLLLLAVGAWWASEWSGAAALAVVGSVASATGLASWVMGIGVDGPLGQGLTVLFVSLLTVTWLAVGASLQTLPAVIDGAPDGGAAAAETAPA